MKKFHAVACVLLMLGNNATSSNLASRPTASNSNIRQTYQIVREVDIEFSDAQWLEYSLQALDYRTETLNSLYYNLSVFNKAFTSLECLKAEDSEREFYKITDTEYAWCVRLSKHLYDVEQLPVKYLQEALFKLKKNIDTFPIAEREDVLNFVNKYIAVTCNWHLFLIRTNSWYPFQVQINNLPFNLIDDLNSANKYPERILWANNIYTQMMMLYNELHNNFMKERPTINFDENTDIGKLDTIITKSIDCLDYSVMKYRANLLKKLINIVNKPAYSMVGLQVLTLSTIDTLDQLLQRIQPLASELENAFSHVTIPPDNIQQGNDKTPTVPKEIAKKILGSNKNIKGSDEFTVYTTYKTGIPILKSLAKKLSIELHLSDQALTRLLAYEAYKIAYNCCQLKNQRIFVDVRNFWMFPFSTATMEDVIAMLWQLINATRLFEKYLKSDAEKNVFRDFNRLTERFFSIVIKMKPFACYCKDVSLVSEIMPRGFFT